MDRESKQGDEERTGVGSRRRGDGEQSRLSSTSGKTVDKNVFLQRCGGRALVLAYHHVVTIPIMIFSHLTVLPLTFLILVEGVFFCNHEEGQRRETCLSSTKLYKPAFYYGLILPACVSII